MTCDEAAFDDGDADFQRFYFGGSPPESDCWPRHAFEDALQGAVPTAARATAFAHDAPESFRSENPAQLALA